MSARWAVVVVAPDARAAVELAKARARAEGLRVRTVCSVRPDPAAHHEDAWRVELAVRDHFAWPGPGSLLCVTCGQPVVGDAMAYRGWVHSPPEGQA